MFTTIRNNWKKTVFFGGVLAYGADYGYDSYRIHRLMRTVCSEAAEYGKEIIHDGVRNRRLLVLLNPTACKRSAEKKFDNYCGPQLYLAGIQVDVVKTESEGFARTYIEELQENPDGILVAGGDGTALEVVTGIMRRDLKCPIGILPLGRTNSVTKLSFPRPDGRVGEVEQLTSATASVIRGLTTKRDVMKIEILEDKTTSETEVTTPKKPVFGLGSLKWGAFRDAISLRDKYWYYGGLREYASIFFNGIRSSRLTWNCRGQLSVTPACEGCKDCYQDPNAKPVYEGKNWWSSLVPKRSSKDSKDVVLVNGENVLSRFNPKCSAKTEISLAEAPELILTTRNVESELSTGVPRMNLRVGQPKTGTMDWIQDSWQRTTEELNSNNLSEAYECRTLELIPDSPEDDRPSFYSIDNEAFEKMPIRVTLLPSHIDVFTN